MDRRLASLALVAAVFFVSFLSATSPPVGQKGTTTTPETASYDTYRALRAFALDGGATRVSGLTLTRDRAEMTFTGTFYFTKPILGATTGAVFVGQGRFRAEPPGGVFEKDNLKRILDAELVESDFETAVLQFTDDSDRVLGGVREPEAAVPPRAQQLADGFATQVLKETGANVASRLLLSMREHERPGVFFAEFDGGRRGRFTFVLDGQGRIPSINFSINAGEKGLIFAHERKFYSNTVWLAFRDLESGQPNNADKVTYSDAFDLVDTPAYTLTVDLREPRKALKISGRIDLVAKAEHVSTIPFMLGESLPERDNIRLKKAIRLKTARIGDNQVEFIQEDWEGGFTLLLPAAFARGERFSVEFEAAGDFVNDEISPLVDAHYPLANDEWYPRSGYLGRATFDITFLHRKRYKVASVGARVKDSAPSKEDKDTVETEYQSRGPIPLATFAMGAYKVHTGLAALPGGDVPLEYLSANDQLIREDLMLSEMAKALEFFSARFGPYPYQDLRAAFHPFAFGQAFPSLLLLPNATPDNRATYLFISHETAHQWWGNQLSWRSYRDQWLSEGFAEYSGILYTGDRDKPSSARELIARHRESLKDAPRTAYGVLGGKVTEIGPLILGHRLASVESTNAYQRLIYNKGALVLRMLHFLLADLSTGDEQPFFDMMKDFADRHHDRAATTESFFEVANEHFARSPIARQFDMKDLNWFFNQWVLQTALPSYRLEYAIDRRPGGTVVVNGTIVQENAPDNWTMPLPVTLHFPGGRTEQAVVLADGPRHDIALMLTERPESVTLDPDMWVLSDKTSTRKRP